MTSRTPAMEYPPDQKAEPDAEDKFKALSEAYGVLADPEKHSSYDRGGFAGLDSMSSEDIYSNINFGDIFGGGGGGGSIFDDIFGFGRGGRRRGPAPGSNVEGGITAPLKRILTGGEETVDYTSFAACPSVEGPTATG